jgi:hypothetical protein
LERQTVDISDHKKTSDFPRFSRFWGVQITPFSLESGVVGCSQSILNPASFKTLLQAIAPFRDGIVIGVECMFGWYWLAGRCAERDMAFVAGPINPSMVSCVYPD